MYHKELLPDYVLLQYEFLYALPEYQKKCTLLDALCQGFESYWSSSSTKESKKFAELGIKKIWYNKDKFLNNDEVALKEVLDGANLCGRAIQITKTTAPHAMSYKLTSLFSIPHGHAVALCLINVLDFMFKIENFDKTDCFELINFIGYKNQQEAIIELRNLLQRWDIKSPPKPTEKEFEILCNSVDTLRLSNHPINLNYEEISYLYRNIWKL